MKKISYNLDKTCSKQLSTLHATVGNLYKLFSVMELNKHAVNVITFDFCMDVAFRPVRLSNLSPNS